MLKRLLQYTLAIGNYMNGSSNKGAAWGFKLSSLDKLQARRMTLLLMMIMLLLLLWWWWWWCCCCCC